MLETDGRRDGAVQLLIWKELILYPHQRYRQHNSPSLYGYSSLGSSLQSLAAMLNAATTVLFVISLMQFIAPGPFEVHGDDGEQ